MPRSVSDTPHGDPAIQTPDRRLRVFVSSTLAELADERRVVARAISALRLTPVMFEAGARPHRPRDLYRAYLAQSDIFVGVYWQRYGQLAAGTEQSGLEEEFELSDGLPRLLYVKVPAPDHDQRLKALIARIAQEASFHTFATPTELGRLVRDDLAALLSERFAATRAVAETPRAPSQLPVAPIPLVGRDEAIGEVAALVQRLDVRLVTLTGPGGIGKTRLALAVGERLREIFTSGTLFVPLEDVRRAELVLDRVARAAGPELAETDSPLETLVDYFGDGRWLIVLDNVEQVLDAGRDIDAMLVRCPGTAVLATSVTELGLRTEREYPVPPLPPPPDPAATPLDRLAASPAVALFVDRAQAVRPDFALTPANAAAVAEICRRLDGLPLAIELAAARTRVLDPDALLARLRRSLDALGTGAVDAPERQQTMRATVEWSMGLLDDTERSFFETMAVFVDGWTNEAAADVAAIDEDEALELTEALVRHSLIYVDTSAFGMRSRMLGPIRRIVSDRLAGRADAPEVARRHADHYRRGICHAERPLRSFSQREWFQRVGMDYGNIEAMTRWYADHDPAELPRVLLILAPFQIMWPFFGIRAEGRREMRELVDRLMPIAASLRPTARAELLLVAALAALDVGDDSAARAAGEGLAAVADEIDDPYLCALCDLAIAWVSAIDDDIGRGLEQALRSVERLHALDDPVWLAVALLTAGGLEVAMGLQDAALRDLNELRELAAGFDNSALAAICRAQLGALARDRGQFEEAREILDEGTQLAVEARSIHALAICLVAFATVSVAEGDVEHAALLMGAADGLRRRGGAMVWTSLRPDARIAEEIRGRLGADQFDQLFAEGSHLDQQQAVAAAQAGGLGPRISRPLV